MLYNILSRILFKRVEIKPEDAVKLTSKYLAEIESETSKANRFIYWILKIKGLRWAIDKLWMDK